MKSKDAALSSKVMRARPFYIKRGDIAYDRLDEICKCAKNMYNFTLFILRNLNFATYPKDKTSEWYISKIPPEFADVIRTKEVVKKGKDGSEVRRTYYSISEFDFQKVCASTNQKDYRAIQVVAARTAIKKAYIAMEGYGKLLKKYLADKSSLSGEPRVPNYLPKEEGRISVEFDCRFNKSDGSIIVNGNTVIPNAYDSVDDEHTVKQIRVTPEIQNERYSVSLVYEENRRFQRMSDNGRYLGIDVGIRNLCAVASNFGEAFIISGEKVVSINEHFNEMMADLQKKYATQGLKDGKKAKALRRIRQDKIDSELHAVSRYIAEYASENSVSKIYIGHNEYWKQDVKLEHNTKRKFIQIPYNSLIEQIKYKCDFYGIEVVAIDEAHTSKCSALDGEEICHHDKYLGKRGGVGNKEFVTKDGILINADINGALNILRRGARIERISPSQGYFSPRKVSVRKGKSAESSRETDAICGKWNG